MPEISYRLKTIAGLVSENARVCDIGTDHGYLPIYLKKHKNVRSVIATDVNEKPLRSAEKNIKESSVQGIRLVLCDGLAGILPGEADTFIIAGMGGEVISGILERGRKILCDGGINVITQPTTSPEVLRRFLADNGFEIIEDIPVLENGKVYSVIKSRFTGIKREYEEWFYYTGNVRPDSEEGRVYLIKQQKRCLKCMQALKGIASKKEIYNYYSEVFRGISRLLD